MKDVTAPRNLFSPAQDLANVLRNNSSHTTKKCNSNPITALEYDDALKVLMHHTQKDINMKKFSGFNLSTNTFILNSGKKTGSSHIKQQGKEFSY